MIWFEKNRNPATSYEVTKSASVENADSGHKQGPASIVEVLERQMFLHVERWTRSLYGLNVKKDTSLCTLGWLAHGK